MTGISSLLTQYCFSPKWLCVYIVIQSACDALYAITKTGNSIHSQMIPPEEIVSFDHPSLNNDQIVKPVKQLMINIKSFLRQSHNTVIPPTDNKDVRNAHPPIQPEYKLW